MQTTTLNPTEKSPTQPTTGTQSSSPEIPQLKEIKAKQKSTWEAGDFGQVARSIENFAEHFMSRQPLCPGMRVLDVACGTGNLAVLAAQSGCVVSGIDIAANLLEQARDRAHAAGLDIDFQEGDAEALPYPDNSFDLTVSMFGVMFTPRPAVAAAELWRVTKPGGQIALANWTPEGFIGKMFSVFKKHLPPPPVGVPSPMEWGIEGRVGERLRDGFVNLRLTRQADVMRYPFPPAETVDFFRKYYGPTLRAFESLSADGQIALREDLVELQTRYNSAKDPGTTAVEAEYLEVVATKR